jgi:hypothetical protein
MMVRENDMRMPLFVAISLLSALVFCQAPAFVQQYAQRLGGTIDALEVAVSHFDEDARRSGYDREAALSLMARNPERLVRDQGAGMSKTIVRLANLRRQQTSLQAPDSIGRLFAFAADCDGEVASRTWQEFRFALSVSPDTVVLAILGFAIAYAILLFASSRLGRFATT